MPLSDGSVHRTDFTISLKLDRRLTFNVDTRNSHARQNQLGLKPNPTT